MKKLVWIFAIATFVGAAAYSLLSLNRWEWTRALYFGLIVVVAEVAIATGLVLRKLGQVSEEERAERQEVQAVLRDRRTAPRRFDWLAPEEVASRHGVFITMLVGGGIVLSGLAWVLDKVAARTTTALKERRIAGELGSIAYPRGGLLPDEVTVLADSLPDVGDPQLRVLLGRDS